MPVASLDDGLHGLTGRGGLPDAILEFAAQYLVFAAVIVFALLWWRRDALLAGLAALAGALLALSLGAAIGGVWDRPRPFVSEHYMPLISHAADASFPSDHLIAVGALTAAAWLCWRPVGIALAVIAVLLGLARAITGIHYLSDVAGGFLLGFALTLLAWWALKPAQPLIDALDRRLQALHLRPPSRAATPPA